MLPKVLQLVGNPGAEQEDSQTRYVYETLYTDAQPYLFKAWYPAELRPRMAAYFQEECHQSATRTKQLVWGDKTSVVPVLTFYGSRQLAFTDYWNHFPDKYATRLFAGWDQFDHLADQFASLPTLEERRQLLGGETVDVSDTEELPGPPACQPAFRGV